VQIVGYETAPGGNDDHAGLFISQEGTVRLESLQVGVELSYSLGERHCAGTLKSVADTEPDGEGTLRHVACDNDDAPYCPVHTATWPCARCTGNCDLPLESCREEHAIYLAAFAPATFKVGVTRSWRLDTRLREQGADHAAHLRTVENGRIARQIEAEIASEIGDRVRVPTKVEGLHQGVDESAWEELLAGYDPIATYDFGYGFEMPERPVAETIASGMVRGTQGRVLVLDRTGSSYAVDMRDLVGYDVTEGGTDRALQSSLGAFE